MTNTQIDYRRTKLQSSYKCDTAFWLTITNNCVPQIQAFNFHHKAEQQNTSTKKKNTVRVLLKTKLSSC